MMHTLKLTLLVGSWLFAASLTAQPVELDSVGAEVMEILNLLEEYEQQEIVIVARSQRKMPIVEELTWLLSTMDEEARGRVLKYIKLKAGSRLKAEKPTAEVYWKESVYNFGSVQEGKIVKIAFEFENIGSVPYEIESVKGSCGCTVANFPANSILPGEKGVITVSFNSVSKKGANTEFVTVVGNTHPKSVALIVEGRVY